MSGINDMKLIGQVIFWTVAVISSCSVMPGRRQFLPGVTHQHPSKELLNSKWALIAVDDKAPDCSLTMNFLANGKLTFTFKDELYDGDHLWYLVKDSVIDFHTAPQEKIVWTSDNCEMNPSVFALYLGGEKRVFIANDELIFYGFDKKKFVFRLLP